MQTHYHISVTRRRISFNIQFPGTWRSGFYFFKKTPISNAKGASIVSQAIGEYAYTLIFCSALIALLPGCSQQKKQTDVVDPQRKEFAKPVVTLLSQLAPQDKPAVFILSSVPPPPVIRVLLRNSTLPTSNKTGDKKIVTKNFEESNSDSNANMNEANGRGFFTTFTTDDGLSLDQVYCSFKDKWGNLWFGTNGGGVSKYDGKSFKNYTTAHGLANDVVWCITQDHDGNLWFGTDGGGVSRFDGESFTNYTTAQGLSDNVIFSILEDDKNNLWFGCLKGVSKWNGKAFTNFSANGGLTNKAVKLIFEDSKGNLWFGTHGGGVGKWDGDRLATYTTSEGLIGNKVWSIAEDNAGNLWFGTAGEGLSKYDGDHFTNYHLFGTDLGDAVLCSVKDQAGNLWFGTQKSGVIKHDASGFVKYTTANGLANDQIRAVTEDDKGNLWFGSFGSGVCKYAGNSFTNFTRAQGLSTNVVFSITEDNKGFLWLGTSGGGLALYDGKQFKHLTKTEGLPHNEIYAVLKDREGNLWLGTAGGGVCKYNGKNLTSYTTTQGLASNIVFSIAEDMQGNLWFGTSGGGVSKFDGRSFTNYTMKQGLAGNVVFCIKEDSRSNLWFGTLGNGVSKFDGESFTNYTVSQGLADNVVWAITEDRQENLWFATQQGLSLRAKEDSGQINSKSPREFFSSLTTKDGLPNNFITQLVQGSDDKLYAGTNLGMCELIPLNSSQAGVRKWAVGRVFNIQHGYPVKDVNAGLNAMYKDSRGTIWISTGSDKTGLVRFDPSALIKNISRSPEVFISQVKINNEEICWRDIINDSKADSLGYRGVVTEEMSTYGRKLTDVERDSLRSRYATIKFSGINKWQPVPQGLVLPYYFNNVSFSFGAVETGSGFLVNYKYFLEGYDKDWSPASHNASASFGNIFEGNYTFRVKAQSPEGVWGEPLSYKFTVLPPWWRTWWMFVVYGILVITAIMLFFKWKHQRMINRHKILEQQVAEATKQVRAENQKVQVQKKKLEETLRELKATQAQLIQSEKMASLGELTAGIAHEIQNPLNFVNNFSEVSNELIEEMNTELAKGKINEAKLTAADIKGNLEKIAHHGKRADAIVKGMLQHSRTSTGHKELTEINKLADDYLRLAYHGLRAKDKSFSASLKTSYDESIGKLAIVPQDIGRVILNLITNAFYAVVEKKKEQLQGYEPTISLSTKKLNETVEIRIADNGKGVPEHFIDKIFQPFFTTKPTGQGTGLGLSLSYDIIKAHGGELTVETRKGEGSAFVISLPASASQDGQ